MWRESCLHEVLTGRALLDGDVSVLDYLLMTEGVPW